MTNFRQKNLLYMLRKRFFSRIYRDGIKNVIHNRDDKDMTSMKIVQLSRPPTPTSIYVQNSSTSLNLGVQFQTNLPPSAPSLQMITNQLKENIIQGWLSSPSFRSDFVFSINSLHGSWLIVWLSFDFFSFNWSLTICLLVALYSCLCGCPKTSRNVFYL